MFNRLKITILMKNSLKLLLK